jgi:cysteine desulfurase
MPPIYLDHNATTPIAPEVLERMTEALRAVFGNPSSSHEFGKAARNVVDAGRAATAELLGVEPDEIVFTSGGTEANNLAIAGLASGRRHGRILTQATEHPSVLQPLARLQRQGFDVQRLPVDGNGQVDPESIRRAISADTILITIQHANNETGTLQPIDAIAELASQHGIPFHVDAAQSAGKIPLRANAPGIALLTLAGHKFRGPKGVGALYVRRGLRLAPLIHGAGHENGLRAGTEAVHQLAGLAEACRLAGDGIEARALRMRRQRDFLHDLLRDSIPGASLHGHPEERLPNTLNIGLPGVSGTELLASIPGLAAATGSACHDGETRPSPVLTAMGVDPGSARGALRLTTGHETTEEEVREAARLLVSGYHALRSGRRVKT